jgi:hypothetical protein
MKNQFTIADEATARDLLNFLQRAKRLDPSGFVKLRAYGNVLAAYVAPVYGSGLNDSSPTIIGMRTMPLDGDFEVDAVVAIDSITSQIDAALNSDFSSPLQIVLPEHQHVAWAGVTPPRSGWHEVGTFAEGDLTDIARRGIAEVADSIPPSVGGPIAAKIRGSIWGRSVDLKTKLPAGAAFVAAGLGFLTLDEQVEVYHSEGWVRLSSAHGHVLAKQSDLY